MGRTDSFVEILEAAVQIQREIAVILEAKAEEAEKARQWICGHVHAQQFAPSALHRQTLDIHEHLVEVIQGITKMEYGLSKNLKVILGKDEEEGGGNYADMLGPGVME